MFRGRISSLAGTHIKVHTQIVIVDQLLLHLVIVFCRAQSRIAVLNAAASETRGSRDRIDITGYSLVTRSYNEYLYAAWIIAQSGSSVTISKCRDLCSQCLAIMESGTSSRQRRTVFSIRAHVEHAHCQAQYKSVVTGKLSRTS